MTDAATTLVERALVGALLSEPGLFEEAKHIDDADFSDRVLGQTFSAIKLQLLSLVPAMARPGLIDSVLAEYAEDPPITREFLVDLGASCPTPDAVSIYARMVLEDHLRREIDALNRRDGESREALGAGAPGHPTADTSNTVADTSPAPSPNPTAHDMDFRAQTENVVLADLLQNPDAIERVRGWLRLDAFTTPMRRDIYAALLFAETEPFTQVVDTVTVSWHANRLHPTSAPAVPVEAVSALAATPVAVPGDTATTLGRVLVMNDVGDNLALRLLSAPSPQTAPSSRVSQTPTPPPPARPPQPNTGPTGPTPRL